MKGSNEVCPRCGDKGFHAHIDMFVVGCGVCGCEWSVWIDGEVTICVQGKEVL